MSTDDSPEEVDGEHEGVRERLEQEAERAAEGFDEGIVDLLSWVLDTETRARIYVYLRENPASTSEEVASGTGLYPSTVREALAELNEEHKVERRKRESDGAGNNPYENTAMAPSELVGNVVGDVQDELNTVFNLDCHLGVGSEERSEPVTITVEDDESDVDGDADGGSEDTP
jgi:DNA-binding transcriptional ArsR family regulator